MSVGVLWNSGCGRGLAALAMVILLAGGFGSATPAQAESFAGVLSAWQAALTHRLTEIGTQPTIGATTIPNGPHLIPGDTGPRTDALIRRLSELGLLSAADPHDGFDSAVEAAVTAFQASAGLKPDGHVGIATLAALNLNSQYEQAAITATLAAMDKFSGAIPDSFALVNLPAQQMLLVQHGEITLSMEAVVGRPSRPTPLLADRITDVVLNPTWTVPPTVMKKDKLPHLRRNGTTGVANAKIWLDGEVVDPQLVDWSTVSPGRIRIVQAPGDTNALGRYRFNLTNGLSIYMHGTNEPALFSKDARAVSSGCVRLSDPRSLAETLLATVGWTPERIADAVAAGTTLRIHLPEALEVRFVYWPATMRAGRVFINPDVYDRVPKMTDTNVAAVQTP